MGLTFTRIRYMIYSIIHRNHYKQADWLRKHHVFAEMGKNCRFVPHLIPSDAAMIKIHNNVSIASNVQLTCHDTINMLINEIEDNPYLEPGQKLKDVFLPIEIFDNCFIGAESTICAGVKIGPNAIVSAGSVVFKDVPPDSVVCGNPAKVIGKFSVTARMRAVQWLEEEE